MGLEHKEQSFIGAGEVFVKPYGSPETDGWRLVGNCGALSIAHAEDEKFVLDSRNSAGGKANSITRISAVTLAANMWDRTSTNIALGAKGTAAAVASGAAVSEVQYGWHAVDRRIILNHLNPTSIVVKDVTDVTTYVLNTDYTIDSLGLITVLSTGAITDGQELHISYSYAAYNKIEALVNSGIEYAVKFYGLNAAQSDTPVVVEMYKVKFGAAGEVSMISDDFVSLDISGEVLSDSSIVGAGLSKYYTIKQVEV